MTAEAQRIAIAQACGWTGFNPDNIPDCLQFTARRADGKWGLIPDYLNDLNACHEFETWLLKNHFDLRAVYRRILIECVGSDGRYWMATAPQRCEAFLKTIGKWTNDN